MALSNFVSEQLEKGIKAGTTFLESNKAINPIKGLGKFVLGESDTGIRGTMQNLAAGDGFKKAVKGAYMNAEGNLNYKAIAGTYVGAAAAGRVLTGGGAYRDSTGRTNLPVVPFI